MNMASSDDSPLLCPISDVNHSSESPPDNASILTDAEYDQDDDDDAEINDEPKFDDDDEEDDYIDQITPDTPVQKIPELRKPMLTRNLSVPLLFQNDLDDVFQYVPRAFLAGVSHKPDDNNSSLTIVNLHFYTDFIEAETACQWQICNKKPLTCQLSINNKCYLDEKVSVIRVHQLCACHPVNATKVPFIERLVRDYIENVSTSMETLKLTRAALNPESRLKYFLELVDKSKRQHYEELLSNSTDESLLNEVLDNEILDVNARTAAKLWLLKPPREAAPSTKNIHYDFKNLPKLHHGYLVQFCEYIEYRLRNLNSLCVMCGKRTFDANDKKASKPAICDDYECFSNAMDSKFRNDPLPPSIFSIEIGDFLLLLVYAAIYSPRNKLILDPYPKLINPCNTSTTLLDQYGDKTENIEILREIIDSLMKMGSITQYEVVKTSLRTMIDLKHPWGFSFFHWLMGTNRYHFSLIPIEHQIKSAQTKTQYFIKHEDIDKHVNFKRLRAEKGTIFAFHGSPQENWHAILRSGLQIGKGQYLLNGAAYGEGIYASPSLAFSAGYARAQAYNNNYSSDYDFDSDRIIQPLDKKRWSCIALCEIIDSDQAYKKHTNDIWTIKDPNLICTRFIFFFPMGTISSSFRVDSAEETTAIRKLIETLNNTVL